MGKKEGQQIGGMQKKHTVTHTWIDQQQHRGSVKLSNRSDTIDKLIIFTMNDLETKIKHLKQIHHYLDINFRAVDFRELP